MKKLKHRATNEIVEETENSYYFRSSDAHLPKFLIEQFPHEWEDITTPKTPRFLKWVDNLSSIGAVSMVNKHTFKKNKIFDTKNDPFIFSEMTWSEAFETYPSNFIPSTLEEYREQTKKQIDVDESIVVGTKFILKYHLPTDKIYTITEINDDDFIVSWTIDDNIDSTTYSKSQVYGFFKKGLWKIYVEELCVPVGTKFTVSNDTTLITISNVIKSDVHVTFVDDSLTYRSYCYDISKVNEFFKTNLWRVYEKKELFVTEDGVKIYTDDEYWCVSVLHQTVFSVIAKNNIEPKDNDNYVRFSTKEAAEKYLDLNIPKYSEKDVINNIENTINVFIEQYGSFGSIFLFKNFLIKEFKINK